MIMHLFSIYDSAPAVFSQPFYQSNKATAIRGFADAVNEKDAETNVYKRHPEFYTLFYLGSYNDETASFTLERVPVKVISALECLKEDTNKAFKVTDASLGRTPEQMEVPGTPKPGKEPLSPWMKALFAKK